MTIFLNVFITAMICFMLFGGIIIVYVVRKRNFNRTHFIDVLLRQHTGGKPQVEFVKCKIHNSKRFGEFLYNHKKKLVIRRFDQEFYLPAKKGRVLLDLTASDGYFYANKYTLLDKYFKNPLKITDEKGKKINFTNKEEFQKSLEDKYKLNEYSDFAGIVNMTPHEDRASRQQTEAILNNLNREVLPWYENKTIVFLTVLVIAGIIALVIIILAMQHAETLIQIAESGRQTGVVDTVTNKITEDAAPKP